MRTRRRRAIVLAAALLAICPQLGHARPVRPDPLVAEAGCDRYRGVPVGANDSTQQFELSVCPTADGVHGKVQTSSLVSGWSVRASKGSWDAAGRVLTLTETEFIESRPEPGWRFCLIDEIVLEKTAKGLEGSYVSTACDDRAELVLEKLEPTAAGVSGTAETRPPVPPSPPPEITPTVEPTPRAADGCVCSATVPSRADAVLWIMMAFAAATVRRRRHAIQNTP
jgi:hypothetical protein